MYTTATQHLAKHTIIYWKLSQIQRGKLDSNISMGRAIKRITTIQAELGPHRKLSSLAKNLCDCFISGLPEIDATQPPQNVVLFPSATTQ
jgi:hypothetical protein